jgi:2-C-methyl-D-erythritol 4-phosphate cytidylyltransferase
MPKAYLPIGGRPLIFRTLERFFSSRAIENVILVVTEKEFQRCGDLLRADSVLGDKPWLLQTGGATRQASAMKGLEKVDAGCEVVVVHDGARPFISRLLIDRAVELARHWGAVVVGLPVRDTIKVVSQEHWVQTTPPRDSLWEIQTPQVFRRELILKAHQRAVREKIEATDDASLVERLGERVYVLEGERANLKITTPEDLLLAEALFREGRTA